MYWGGVELAEICRLIVRCWAKLDCCTEPLLAIAPVRGGITGGGPGGGPLVRPWEPVEGVGEVTKLSVDVCDGIRGGNCGSGPADWLPPLVRGPKGGCDETVCCKGDLGDFGR